MRLSTKPLGLYWSFIDNRVFELNEPDKQQAQWIDTENHSPDKEWKRIHKSKKLYAKAGRNQHNNQYDIF